jgi:anti-anti-sigma regulatory factor
MFHAEANKTGGVLTMSFAHHVDAAQMNLCLERVTHLLNDMESGFRLMTDLSSLDSMDAECAQDLGAMMDLCSKKGVKGIFRVIPDPQKDIGFTILSHLHYGPDVTVTTYDNLADAIHGLTT